MRGRMNKWIFGAALSLVLTIPFLIPGCAPVDDSSSLTGMVVGSVTEPLTAVANDNATAAGRATTLDDVLTAGGAGTAGQMFTLTRNGDHIDVTVTGQGPSCQITIDNGKAVSSC